jgi:hypothetical protein
MAPIRVFIIMFALGLSQAWAFEGFHELWNKKSSADNAELEKLRSERASQFIELKKIEPSYQFIVDEVKSLLPNMIGAIEGKGAKLDAEDITSLCSELKRELLVPSACSHYLKTQSGRHKEELINIMQERQNLLNVIRSRYKAAKQKVIELDQRIQVVESKS